MPLSSALGTCSVQGSTEEQVLCQRAHLLFFRFPYLRFWHHSSFVKCYQSADILTLLSGAFTSFRIILYLYMLHWNQIGMQDEIFPSWEPPHDFEPPLGASIVFSGRICFCHPFCWIVSFLSIGTTFVFPIFVSTAVPCIPCTVHNSCWAVVSEQNYIHRFQHLAAK